MKKAQAYQALGLTESATQEEVKKAFKNRAKTLHPDINKSPTAEADFKKINEAYQAIENNEFDDQRAFSGSPFGGVPFGVGGINLNDIFGFGNFGQQRPHSPPPQDIYTEQTITFKEAILGCKKEITFKCEAMCDKCRGEGEFVIDNGCATCKGKGRITGQQGNMIWERPCPKCKGQVKSEKCQPCSSKGTTSSQRTISLNIKPGIINGNSLRLTAMGNFSASYGNSNVYVVVKITPDPNLTMQDQDVITTVKLSLLEALTGCTKNVYTIDGQQDITIPAASKNKEEVILSKLGVNRQGNERVIINIDYPQKIEELIIFLQKETL